MIIDKRNRKLSDLRISVTDSCNFRCTYCMPKEIFGEPLSFLPQEKHLTFDEILTVAGVAAELGVRKIKITGGEPLLRAWLSELIRKLHHIHGIEDIALITNGYHFEAHARALKNAGLKRVTISIDSLNEETFGRISGRSSGLHKVLKAIDLAYNMEFRPLKLNMVVQKGINDHEIFQFVERFRKPGIELRFIEFMDVGYHMKFNPELVLPSAIIHQQLSQKWDLVPLEPAYPGEVARCYAHRDGQGQIGYISSMSNPFCSGCSRLRLTADGQLFTCLFAKKGLDIRRWLRSKESEGYNQLKQALSFLWRNRDDAYSENRSREKPTRLSRRDKKPEMYHIGG